MLLEEGYGRGRKDETRLHLMPPEDVKINIVWWRLVAILLPVGGGNAQMRLGSWWHRDA